MKCPGQDMQYWTSEAIYEVKCPRCSATVEFYKDDTSRKCGHCGHRFINPKMDFGCASYCQFADQCLGHLPEEFQVQRDNLLKDKVAVEMKRYFKSDFKRISHASKVALHAERIGKIETADLAVILCASYLLHIGYPEAVAKYGEKEGALHIEEESVPLSQDILNRLGANSQLISSVCEIIDNHGNPGRAGSKEFAVVSDANALASLEERQKKIPMTKDQLSDFIKNLRTEGGKSEARELAGRLGLS
jgi:DNA-directed RNA polymerase subunit RPC12/RpoP